MIAEDGDPVALGHEKITTKGLEMPVAERKTAIKMSMITT